MMWYEAMWCDAMQAEARAESKMPSIVCEKNRFSDMTEKE